MSAVLIPGEKGSMANDDGEGRKVGGDVAFIVYVPGHRQVEYIASCSMKVMFSVFLYPIKYMGCIMHNGEPRFLSEFLSHRSKVDLERPS
jgi:hypothetical protein